MAPTLLIELPPEATAAARPQVSYTRDTVRRHHRSCRHGRHPTVGRDGSRTTNRNPRRVGISSIALPACACLFVPIEIRPDVGASLSAHLAGELGLNVGQPVTVRPLVAADRYRMAAAIVRAIDQETAHARGAHLGEGDLLWAGKLWNDLDEDIVRFDEENEFALGILVDRKLGNPRNSAEDSFWFDPDDRSLMVPSNDYVMAFLDGASDVWDELEGKI